MRFSDQKFCIFVPNLARENIWIGWNSHKYKSYATVLTSYGGLKDRVHWGPHVLGFDCSNMYELPCIFKWLYDAERLSRESTSFVP